MEIQKLTIQKLTIAGKKYEYPDTTALVGKINELVDAVNELQEKQYIYKKSSITRAKNVQSDVKTRPVTVSELAYLQKENNDLKDELERTRKALDVATKCINWVIDTFQKGLEHESDVVGCCELSLERIKELEQKD